MAVDVKICGLKTDETVAAAVSAGAAYVGLVFFPRSPRNVSADDARALVAALPKTVVPVGLTVDPDDALVETIAETGARMLQFHGSETPERLDRAKQATGCQVMKAISIETAADLDRAEAYLDVADMLLFDAKPPKDLKGAMPGGNAVSFDWTVLAGRDWPIPWMLSGGLDAANVADAIRISGARAVDVSSGVESAPGEKDPDRIRAFIGAAKGA